MIEIIKYSGQTAEELFGKRDEITYNVEEKVKAIIADVRENGDGALRKYSAAFDGYTGCELEVSTDEIDEDFVTKIFAEIQGKNINFHSKKHYIWYIF